MLAWPVFAAPWVTIEAAFRPRPRLELREVQAASRAQAVFGFEPVQIPATGVVSWAAAAGRTSWSLQSAGYERWTPF